MPRGTPSKLAPTPPATESFRNCRLLMTALLEATIIDAGADEGVERGAARTAKLARGGARAEHAAQQPGHQSAGLGRCAHAVRRRRRRRRSRPASAHVARAVNQHVVEPRGAVRGSNRLVADDALRDLGCSNERTAIAGGVDVFAGGRALTWQQGFGADRAARSVSHASTTIAEPRDSCHEARRDPYGR